jgi:hypothetical protein
VLSEILAARVFGSSKIPEKKKKLKKYKPPLVRLYTVPHDASFTSRAIWYISFSVSHSIALV